MKGLIPWLREALFGPPGAASPECSRQYCHSYPDPDCRAGNCTSCCCVWCPSSRCGSHGQRVIRVYDGGKK